jgi:MtN3 and saliva related transmembrane protein
MVELIGFVAAATGSLAFFPQVIKTYRSRSCGDLSTGMVWALITAAVLWVIYGLNLRSAPIVAGNSVTLALSVSLLVQKLRWGSVTVAARR